MRYINADDLIKLFNTKGLFGQGIYQAIEEMPTADVKPIVYGEWETSSQQGEICWIEDENGKNKEVLEYGEIVTCKCSNCGYEMGELALEFNFCPNCGAYMKGADE